MLGPSGFWLSRVTGMLGALLAVALVARLAWELLMPLVPGLLVIFSLLLAFKLIVGRYRQS